MSEEPNISPAEALVFFLGLIGLPLIACRPSVRPPVRPHNNIQTRESRLVGGLSCRELGVSEGIPRHTPPPVHHRFFFTMVEVRPFLKPGLKLLTTLESHIFFFVGPPWGWFSREITGSKHYCVPFYCQIRCNAVRTPPTLDYSPPPKKKKHATSLLSLFHAVCFGV